jgi:hypothetical protein
VERLPVSPWLFYLALWLTILVPYALVKWRDGSPLTELHALWSGTGVIILALIHYLNRTAAATLAEFRPVLVADENEYQALRYRLTTLPSRWALWPSIVVGLLAGAEMLADQERFRLYGMNSSPLALSIEVAFNVFLWMAVTLLFVHTIHQLRLVSAIHRQHTRVNLFQLGPLYAFSRLTARTALAISGMHAAWFLAQLAEGPLQPVTPTMTVGLALLVVIAFVWPLLGARTQIAREKQRLLAEIAQRLEAAYSELDRRLDRGELGDTPALKSAIETLAARHAQVARVSAWPWSVETLRTVLAALSLPLLIWVIERLIDRFVFLQP